MAPGPTGNSFHYSFGCLLKHARACVRRCMCVETENNPSGHLQEQHPPPCPGAHTLNWLEPRDRLASAALALRLQILATVPSLDFCVIFNKRRCGVQACHAIHEEVRGQFPGTCSFLPPRRSVIELRSSGLVARASTWLSHLAVNTQYLHMGGFQGANSGPHDPC